MTLCTLLFGVTVYQENYLSDFERLECSSVTNSIYSSQNKSLAVDIKVTPITNCTWTCTDWYSPRIANVKDKNVMLKKQLEFAEVLANVRSDDKRRRFQETEVDIFYWDQTWWLNEDWEKQPISVKSEANKAKVMEKRIVQLEHKCFLQRPLWDFLGQRKCWRWAHGMKFQKIGCYKSW